MEELMKEFEKFMEGKMGKKDDENRKKFDENRDKTKEKVIEMIDEAGDVFIAANERRTILSGGLDSILSCICCMLEALQSRGIPKDIIKTCLSAAFFDEDTTKSDIIAELEKMIDKM